MNRSLSWLPFIGLLVFGLFNVGCDAPTEASIVLEANISDQGLVREYTVTSPQTIDLMAGVAMPEGMEVEAVTFSRNGAAQAPEMTERTTGSPQHQFYVFPWSITQSHNGTAQWTATVRFRNTNGQLQTLTSNAVTVTVNIQGTGLPPNPEGMAHIGLVPAAGTARDVVVHANLAYVASDEFGLSILDVSDPSSPTPLGAPVPSFPARYVYVNGTRAILTGGAGLRVVDVSDPTLPETIGFLEGNFRGAVVVGQYLYARLGVPGNPGHSDLVTVDLRDPTNPVVIDQIFVPSGSRIRAVGTNLYIVTGSGVAVYDVSTPSSPESVDSLSISGGAAELAVAGSYAYVGNTTGIHAVNISNPSNLTLAGSVNGSSWDLSVSGSRLHAVLGSQLRIYDISNPGYPSLLFSDQGFASSWALYASGSFVFLASPESVGAGGLHVVDASVPTAPIVVGHAPNDGSNRGVAVSGSLAVATGSGLQVVDVSDPFAPTKLGKIEGLFSGVAASGNYAYSRLTVPGNPGHTDLVVVDLATPTNPTIINQTYLGGGDTVEVVGSLVYVTTGAGLEIFDITSPRSPQPRGSLVIPNGARELAVQGSHAYVGNLSEMHVVNVSDPANPFIAGSITGGMSDLAVAGDRVFQVFGDNSRLIDVSNPASPRELGTGDGYAGWGVEIAGTFAFVASPKASDGGVYVLDFSDPSNIEEVHYFSVPGDARSVVLEGDYIYVGDDSATIDIIELQ